MTRVHQADNTVQQSEISSPPIVPAATGRTLPLIIQPGADNSLANLKEWLTSNQEHIHALMLKHGAILLRGFAVTNEQDFEQIAKLIDPELKNDYMGTSPRDIQEGTDYVFSASELPPHYPIPQHCEMTFIKNPPRRLFFSCMIQPEAGGGETPLVDFRRVHAMMDSKVKQRFAEKGIKIIRNYSGPNEKKLFKFLELKSWTDIFGHDKEQAQQRAEQEDFEVTWTKNGGLRLTSYQPAFLDHPQTDETAWYSHLQVFHASTASAEFKRIYKLRPSLRYLALWRATQAINIIENTLKKPDQHPMHCTYADGSKIPARDIEHIRDLIWENMIRTPWQKGDVLAIDNYSIAHGRLPYTGKRKVVVAWA